MISDGGSPIPIIIRFGIVICLLKHFVTMILNAVVSTTSVTPWQAMMCVISAHLSVSQSSLAHFHQLEKS